MNVRQDFCIQKFIQHFMWKKLCNVGEVVELYEDCLKESTGDTESISTDKRDEILAAISSVNRSLEPLYMKISKADDEKTGDIYYALISTNTSDLVKLQTTYSKQELDFINKLIESIVTSGDGKVDIVTALNLTDKLIVRISKRDLEKLLLRLCDDKWLVKDNDDFSLSVRARLELEPYLRNEYADYVSFCICKSIVLQHYVECENCDVKLHKNCLKKYFTKTPDRKCPECNELWTSEFS